MRLERAGTSRLAAALLALVAGWGLAGCRAVLQPPARRPRLVVVVSIDQFPRSYLDRLDPLFADRGFRRLQRGGADYVACHHGQASTLTGPGHAVMLTGTYPVHHGVIGNSWYARDRDAVVGCVEDPRYPQVGSPGTAPPAEDLGVSPLALLSGTVGDELRHTTGGAAKVVGVSIKDRGAVLLAGWRPTAAYWWDPRQCHFVSSTYYLAQLPAWVADFNGTQPCAPYHGAAWNRLLPEPAYAGLADRDDMPYETDALGLGRRFPHPLAEAADPAPGRFAAVATTPFGNELLVRFARAAIQGEDLGRDDVPDVLTVSLSTNDYIGHLYGPDSQEVADAAARTDRELAALMDFLDTQVGAGRWLLALTSDHGVSPVPDRLERDGLLPPRRDHYRFDAAAARRAVEQRLAQRFFGQAGPPPRFPGFFEAWGAKTEPFVYVDARAAEALPERPSADRFLQIVGEEIERLDGVARVYRRTELPALAASRDPIEQRVFRSWHPRAGGDLYIRLAPYWLDSSIPFGTTHGTPYAYDTHVPMLLYGPGIRPGRFTRPVAVVDLAPTLAQVLGVSPPPYNEGEPLSEALGGAR